jgi:hypothetical protein
MNLAFQNGNRYAIPGDDHYAAVLRACTTVNGSSEENAEAYEVARMTLDDYLEIETTNSIPNENIMLLYLQAYNALLAADESRAWNRRGFEKLSRCSFSVSSYAQCSPQSNLCFCIRAALESGCRVVFPGRCDRLE